MVHVHVRTQPEAVVMSNMMMMMGGGRSQHKTSPCNIEETKKILGKAQRKQGKRRQATTKIDETKTKTRLDKTEDRFDPSPLSKNRNPVPLSSWLKVEIRDHPSRKQ